MIKIGYHASHEQFPPSVLLEHVRHAERAGFQSVLSSDHFHPWTNLQSESGFAWAWLGAAMQATALPFGVVNAPGQRYHPAIIAQAAATLAEMFPDRFFLCVGSGQLVNEGITGAPWPAKDQRNARLRECVDVLRALWRGETVTHRGLVVVEQATLHTLPKRAPLLAGAAITPETARWVGGWADALITTSRPPAELKKMVEAFREGGGGGKPMFLKVQLSWAKDEQVAHQGAFEQWRGNVFASEVLTDLRLPSQFDDLGARVSPEVVVKEVRISSDLARQAAWLEEDLALGFSQLFLHNVNREQRPFIEAFGERVLPRLSKEARR